MTQTAITQKISSQASKRFEVVKNLRTTHPGLFWILVFTVVSRLVVYLTGQPWDQDMVAEILDGDAVVYDRIARAFLDGVWISDMPWAADRTFGYPVFLTFVYAISNNAIWLVLALQTLLNVLMVPMVYWASKEIFSTQKSGTVAAALFALSAISLAWAARYLFTETLFAFSFLIFVMVYLRAWRSDSFRWFLLLGVLLGIGTIVRSVLQFYVVIPVIIILVQNREMRRKAVLVVAVLVGLLATIGPFQAINYSTYGHYSISSISGKVLTKSMTQAKADAEGINFYDARDSLGWQDWLDIENPFDHSAISKNAAIEYVKSRPQEWIYLNLLGMVSFVIGTEKSSYLYVIARQERPALPEYARGYESFSERIIRNLKGVQQEYFLMPLLLAKLLVEYVFIAAGLWILIRSKQKTLALFLVLSIAYFIFVTAFMGRAPRYKIPVLPIYAIIGGGGAMLVWAYWQQWRESRKRTV